MSCNCCSTESPDDPFCGTCRANAMTILSLNEAVKVVCFRCKKEFKRETVAAHNGFCGRCAGLTPVVPEHKRKQPGVALRRAVWEQYIGVDRARAPCYCCGAGPEIDVWNFECGHVEAHAKDGELTVDNLRPICGVCNRSMGTQNMLEFVRTHRYRSKMATEEIGLGPEIEATYVQVPRVPRTKKAHRWTPHCAIN